MAYPWEWDDDWVFWLEFAASLCSVTDCKARSFGGGFFLGVRWRTTTENCNFTGCVAGSADDGGGCGVAGTSQENDVSMAIFLNCAGRGALTALGDDNAWLAAFDCTFIGSPSWPVVYSSGEGAMTVGFGLFLHTGWFVADDESQIAVMGCSFTHDEFLRAGCRTYFDDEETYWGGYGCINDWGGHEFAVETDVDIVSPIIASRCPQPPWDTHIYEAWVPPDDEDESGDEWEGWIPPPPPPPPPPGGPSWSPGIPPAPPLPWWIYTDTFLPDPESTGDPPYDWRPVIVMMVGIVVAGGWFIAVALTLMRARGLTGNEQLEVVFDDRPKDLGYLSPSGSEYE
jgi:hypothetical protein